MMKDDQNLVNDDRIMLKQQVELSGVNGGDSMFDFRMWSFVIFARCSVTIKPIERLFKFLVKFGECH